MCLRGETLRQRPRLDHRLIIREVVTDRYVPLLLGLGQEIGVDQFRGVQYVQANDPAVPPVSLYSGCTGGCPFMRRSDARTPGEGLRRQLDRHEGCVVLGARR